MKEHLPTGLPAKHSRPGQIVFEKLAPLCSDDSIQILLNLAQFLTELYFDLCVNSQVAQLEI